MRTRERAKTSAAEAAGQSDKWDFGEVNGGWEEEVEEEEAEEECDEEQECDAGEEGAAATGDDNDAEAHAPEGKRQRRASDSLAPDDVVHVCCIC